MRTHSRCPKCNGTRIYVCHVQQPDGESSNVIYPFYVATSPIPKEEIGAEKGSAYRTHAGHYETWICAACGYTEWYARDPEHLLEKLAKHFHSGVKVIDSASQTPFR